MLVIEGIRPDSFLDSDSLESTFQQLAFHMERFNGVVLLLVTSEESLESIDASACDVHIYTYMNGDHDILTSIYTHIYIYTHDYMCMSIYLHMRIYVDIMIHADL